MKSTYATDIQVRYQDIDPLDHVSYPVFVTYMQQARLDFSHEVLEMDSSVRDTVVVHLEVNYERQITVGEDVTVAMAIPTIGDTSFTTTYEVRIPTGVAATGETVQVVIDATTGDPIPVPPEWKDRIKETGSANHE